VLVWELLKEHFVLFAPFLWQNLFRLENALHPKALANAAKHLAFTRCGEMNVYGMVDTQVAAFKDDLMAAV